MTPIIIPRISRSNAIPATAPSDKPDRWVVTSVGTVWLLVVQLHVVQLHVVQLHVAMGLGPLLVTYRDGVTETLGEIWIRNGSWEPTVLLVMLSTACWAMTIVAGSIFARLVRLEIWNETNMWVPFSVMIWIWGCVCISKCVILSVCIILCAYNNQYSL